MWVHFGISLMVGVWYLLIVPIGCIVMAMPRATDKYLFNLKKLVEFFAELLELPGMNREAIARDFDVVIGANRITSTMLGRYHNGKQSGRVQPPTHLGFAEYLHKKVRWGKNLDEALMLVYDWLFLSWYGPDKVPADADPNRHEGLPTVAKIQAMRSTKLQSLAEMVPEMSQEELVRGIRLLTDQLEYAMDSAADPAPVAAPTAEPICHDDKPFPKLLYRAGLLQARPKTKAEREAAIQQLSDLTGLSPSRARAVLCGQAVESSEIEPLSKLLSMSTEEFTDIASMMGALLISQNV